ncbi:MAG: hypothetical protein ABMA14_22455 [Hyphomonadaceae bacterium]
MLRAFAWLVSNVGSMFGMFFNRPTRDWHTDAAQEDQLPAPNDIQKETFSAANTGASKALMVSSTQSVRPSNHGGVLTSGSVFKEHAFPAKAGIQSARKARSFRSHRSPVIPAEAHQHEEPEPRSDARRRKHTQPLASGSRAPRASRMTSSV